MPLTKVARLCKGLKNQNKTRFNLGPQRVNKLLGRIDKHTHIQNSNLILSFGFKYHMLTALGFVPPAKTWPQSFRLNFLLIPPLNCLMHFSYIVSKHKSQLCSLLFSVIFVLIDGTTVHLVCWSEKHMVKSDCYFFNPYISCYQLYFQKFPSSIYFFPTATQI